MSSVDAGERDSQRPLIDLLTGTNLAARGTWLRTLDNPAPHAGEKDTVDVHDEDTAAKDASSDASKPQGTLRDQVDKHGE